MSMESWLRVSSELVSMSNSLFHGKSREFRRHRQKAPWVIKRRDVEHQQPVERVKMSRKGPSPADPNQQTLIFQ